MRFGHTCEWRVHLVGTDTMFHIHIDIFSVASQAKQTLPFFSDFCVTFSLFSEAPQVIFRTTIVFIVKYCKVSWPVYVQCSRSFWDHYGVGNWRRILVMICPPPHKQYCSFCSTPFWNWLNLWELNEYLRSNFQNFWRRLDLYHFQCWKISHTQNPKLSKICSQQYLVFSTLNTIILVFL